MTHEAETDRIKSLITEVRKIGLRVRIILSRTSPDLVRCLFEQEVPEIADEVIDIKRVAREPGARTKIAVLSYDDRVDPIGACVGIRGTRIKAITEELNGEKVDIIPWSDDDLILLENALRPAEISRIEVDEESNSAIVLVSDDQLSLAIGRRGQNVRLASKLTGWDVSLKSMSDLQKETEGPSTIELEGESDLAEGEAPATEGEAPVSEPESQDPLDIASETEAAAPEAEPEAAEPEAAAPAEVDGDEAAGLEPSASLEASSSDEGPAESGADEEAEKAGGDAAH